MKIGFDIQALQTGSKASGIGRYSYNLLKSLLELYPNNEYILFANGLYDRGSIPFKDFKNVSQNIISYLPLHDYNPINRHIQHIHYRSIDIDLVHVLSPFEFHYSSVISNSALRGKTVVTLYDIIPAIFENLYLTSGTTKKEYYARLGSALSADLILAISEVTRSDAINLMGVAPDKIINIGCSISDDFYHIENLEASLVQQIRQKYGIASNFIFNLGSIDIRKNQKGLITAFSNLPPDLLKKYTLVIACNFPIEDTGNLRVFAKKKAKNKVIFLHCASDEKVNILYNICDLFVMPSLYEGFGLPVLEAMKCGAPVIASNTSSIPEISGRKDNLFDPKDIGSITRLMVKVLRNKNYMEELRRHGMEQAKKFSWENVAKKTMESYEFYINNKKRILEKKEKSNKTITLGMVTTWNTRCGIANYSKYLINNLDKEIQSKIFANCDCELNGPDVDNVFRCWGRGWNKGDIVNLYEEIVKQGIQVINIQYNFGFFSVKQLGDLIIQLKGKDVKVIITFHSTAPAEIRGILQSLERIAVELRCADAILVHSRNDMDRLKGYGVIENVILFPHGILVFDDVDNYTLRKKMGINNSRIIATFGFLLPHKGVLEVIESLSYLINQYPDILYLVIGSIYPDYPPSDRYLKQCKDKVGELNLEIHVKFLIDYLEEKAIANLLHLADMIVLPYKDTKESASGSTCIALGAKRPIITTSNSIFDDVKNEVYQIESCNPINISDAISMLYEDKDLYAKLLKATIEKCERERWEVISKRYVDIVCGCYSNDLTNEFKWIDLIDDISKELIKIRVKEKSDIIDTLAKEIYHLYLAENKFS